MFSHPLTDAEYVKQVLAKAGTAPKRSLGQNFLISPEVVEAIVETAAAGPRQVTELGPGIGTATQALSQQSFSVRAIEKDDSFIAILQKHAPNAEIIHADLQDVNWTWDEPYQIVGNIPYNLTGLIIRRITQLEKVPNQVILLVQSEVADRILAEPPDMSLLCLAVQLWGTATHVITVPKNCFWPQPRVHSALILITPHQTEIPHRESIMELARICFQGKRKQIAGSLKRSEKYDEETITAALEACNISATARPQELSANQWQDIWLRLS